MSEEEFATIVSESSTYREVLQRMGYTDRGHAYYMLRERIDRDKVDDSHIRGVNRGQKAGLKLARPLAEYLVLDGPLVGGQSLKRKLLKAGLMRDECSVCGQPPWWNEKPLSLQLDHINGNRRDNRLENLRIICPHCHTQTDTFAGRNSSQRKTPSRCLSCDLPITRGSDRCIKCANRENKPRLKHTKTGLRYTAHVTSTALREAVWSKPVVQVAADLGLSDVAVHKLCVKLGVEKPPRGYFTKGKPRAVLTNSYSPGV